MIGDCHVNVVENQFWWPRTPWGGMFAHFKLSVDNPVSAANDQIVKDNKQNNTTCDSSLKMILGIKDDNLLDEVATLDVIESPANDILISDAGS